ncbi:hypothetical protein LJ739_06855 [Aestuariibacter halophilus]|uniref:Uncharacterized protein n=1 Tax=Fluctibacter halophilus TaxID=226011 RepID=A0ABS8G758_9ALTE|nr:hypothetical protein [Aestuariibacter halophilus]MCC2615956.1 hypothetical protein [Aestuariibacter halophilus]
MTQTAKIDKSEHQGYAFGRADGGIVYMQIGHPNEEKRVVAFNEFQFRQFIRDAQAMASADLAEVLCRK